MGTCTAIGRPLLAAPMGVFFIPRSRRKIMKLMRSRRQLTLMTLSILTTAMVLVSAVMIAVAPPSSYVSFLAQRLLIASGAVGLAGILIIAIMAATERLEHR
jgi:hypothetical protein